MDNTLWLRIDKQESMNGDIKEITWEPYFQQVEMPVVKEYWKKCDKRAYDYALNMFRNEIQKLENEIKRAETKEHFSYSIDLQKSGETLFRNFVDEKFYEEYNSKCKEVYISTRMIYVPWELITAEGEGEKPWGIKYAIGNQIRGPMNVRTNKAIYKEGINILFIAADNEGLTKNQNEILKIRNSLIVDNRIKCDILLRSNPFEDSSNVHYFELTFDEVLNKLRDPKYDIIHFAGHIIEPDEKGLGSSLLIKDNERLYSKTIYDNLGGTPFVFLNGCGIMWEKSSLIITHIADGFLYGGARGVIVPRTSIWDDDAERIGIRFYELILEGKRFGEALRVIREEEYDRDPKSINWITYVLIGKPSFRLFSIEREIFLLDNTIKMKTINSRVFDDETIDLLKETASFAHQCHSKIDMEHLLLAFTKEKIFARLSVDSIGDDLWRVIRDLQREVFLSLGMQSNSTIREEQILLKEELFAEPILSVLKEAHAISDSSQCPKIRPIDLLKAFFIHNDQNVMRIIQKVFAQYQISQFQSVSDFNNALNDVKFENDVPESLSMNLYTMDGKFNHSFLTDKMNKVLSVAANVTMFTDKKLEPEDLLWICGFIPEMNTKKYFDKSNRSIGEVGEIIKKLMMSDGLMDLELTVDSLMDETEGIFKEAAREARAESMKLDEVHLIRKFIQYAELHENNLPKEVEELLMGLKSDTILWDREKFKK